MSKSEGIGYKLHYGQPFYWLRQKLGWQFVGATYADWSLIFESLFWRFSRLIVISVIVASTVKVVWNA